MIITEFCYHYECPSLIHILSNFMQAECAVYGGKLMEIESSEENTWMKGELRKVKPGIYIMLVVFFYVAKSYNVRLFAFIKRAKSITYRGIVVKSMANLRKPGLTHFLKRCPE